MITEVISARPDQTMADALEIFQQKKIRGMPVLDDDNHVIGIFNFHLLLRALLPAPAAMEDDDLMRLKHISLSLDHITGVTPWLERRLQNGLPRTLDTLMVRKFKTVRPDTPLREGVRLLVEYGSPIPVVVDDKNTIAGIITSQSTIKAIQNLRAHISQDESDN